MAIIDLNTNQFSYKDNTFVAEISDLKVSVSSTDQIRLTSHVTGNHKMFRYLKTDRDASGEDTYGWRFISGQYNLLIIND